jgi:hypothetical protein
VEHRLPVYQGDISGFSGSAMPVAYRYQLAPSGVTRAQLRAHPEGVRVPLAAQLRQARAT